MSVTVFIIYNQIWFENMFSFRLTKSRPTFVICGTLMQTTTKKTMTIDNRKQMSQLCAVIH